MQADHQAFLAAGGNLKYAKEFNNVIGEHFMDIDIDHVSIASLSDHYTFIRVTFHKVCLPGLHITLGVYLRLFTLLEDDCHKLDMEMAELTSPQSGDRPSYTNYTKVIQTERDLLDELDCMKGQLKWLEQTLTLTTLNSSNPSTDPQVHTLVTLIKEKKKRICDIVGPRNTKIIIIVIVHVFQKRAELSSISQKTLPRKDGPFVRCLDDALASFNVHRQAYHSGSFVGNHIHRALKVWPLPYEKIPLTNYSPNVGSQCEHLV